MNEFLACTNLSFSHVSGSTMVQGCPYALLCVTPAAAAAAAAGSGAAHAATTTSTTTTRANNNKNNNSQQQTANNRKEAFIERTNQGLWHMATITVASGGDPRLIMFGREPRVVKQLLLLHPAGRCLLPHLNRMDTFDKPTNQQTTKPPNQPTNQQSTT